MKTYPVDLPDSTLGRWKITHQVVTPGQAQIEDLRYMRTGIPAHRPAGTYTSLWRDDVCIMTNIPDAVLDHEDFIESSYGNILVAGLGLGMVARALAERCEVTSVTVIELDQDVIDLVGPSLSAYPKISIICADIHTWTPPDGSHWDMAWFDIWDDITETVEGSKVLHERFKAFASHCDSWGLGYYGVRGTTCVAG